MPTLKKVTVAVALALSSARYAAVDRKAQHPRRPAVGRDHDLQREPRAGEGPAARELRGRAQPPRAARGERPHAPGNRAAAKPVASRQPDAGRAELRLRPAHAGQAAREVRRPERAHRAAHIRPPAPNRSRPRPCSPRRAASCCGSAIASRPGCRAASCTTACPPTCATGRRSSPSSTPRAPAARRSSSRISRAASPGKRTTSPS